MACEFLQLIQASAYDSMDVMSHILTHDNLSYVNLEDFEPLLRPKPHWCSEPYDQDHSQHIELPFRETAHFIAARDAWQRDDLLVVVEHESCYEGHDERSVYRYVALEFTRAVL